jgi:PTS system nitrogen regulatory IIA component
MGSAPVSLAGLLKPGQVNLALKASSRDGILKELVCQAPLSEKTQQILLVNLRQREELGSTGIGRGVAIPHCRSLVLNSLALIAGRSKAGVDFGSIDKKPARLFFLIIAPPHDPKNLYLITLGKIAQLAKDLPSTDPLFTVETSGEFIGRIAELEKQL